MNKIAVILALIFIFGTFAFVFNVHKLFVLYDTNQQQETEDGIFLAHGCSIDNTRNVYVCPNGLPPGQ